MTTAGKQQHAADRATFTLDQDQAGTVIAALEDAAASRRETSGHCWYCTQSPSGLCPDHHASLHAADVYDALRQHLDPALSHQPQATPDPAAPPDASSGRETETDLDTPQLDPPRSMRQQRPSLRAACEAEAS